MTDSFRSEYDGFGADLLVFGDIALDVIVHAGRMPGLPTSDVITRSITTYPGGSAANCAVTAARLGARVAFVGVTGTDPVSELLVADLVQNGVAIDFLHRVDADPAVVVAIDDGEDRRRMYSHRGPASHVPYGTPPAGLFSRCKWLHLSGYSFQDEVSRLTALELMDQARCWGCTVSLDPSFHSAHEFRTNQATALGMVDVLLPNREEASAISGLDDPILAAQAIRRRGPAIVVVKLGDAGCVAVDGETVFREPGFSLETVQDTLGAGDAFGAGFIVARLAGMDVAWSCVLADATAACSVRQAGGHTGSPTRGELLRFLREHGQAGLAQQLDNR